jgi:hypothetical protein
MRELTLSKIFAMKWRKGMNVDEYYKESGHEIMQGFNLDRSTHLISINSNQDQVH